MTYVFTQPNTSRMRAYQDAKPVRGQKGRISGETAPGSHEEQIPLTPANLHESICTIPCGLNAFRIVACLNILSGAVGSSMNLFPCKSRLGSTGRTRVPRLDLPQPTHILDRLIHVPHLVRVNYQHRPCRSRVFSL